MVFVYLLSADKEDTIWYNNNYQVLTYHFNIAFAKLAPNSQQNKKEIMRYTGGGGGGGKGDTGTPGIPFRSTELRFLFLCWYKTE